MVSDASPEGLVKEVYADVSVMMAGNSEEPNI
jgi:hypothetical protein